MRDDDVISVAPKTPFKVLVIDDEPSDRELLSIALSGTSGECELFSAADGWEALSLLRKSGVFSSTPRPDLIILDLNIPGLDGRQILKEIKLDEELKEIPIVILSTSYDEKDILSSYRLGAASYIVKPGNFHEFKILIQKFKAYWFETAVFPRFR